MDYPDKIPQSSNSLTFSSSKVAYLSYLVKIDINFSFKWSVKKVLSYWIIKS